MQAALEFSPHVGTLVMQPTPLCNMRCSYCYLQTLDDRSRMSPKVSSVLAHAIARYPRGHRVEVCWHGGEPLTVGIEHLAELFKPFEQLRASGRVQHSLQTNATLITDEWCEFFRDYDVGVGVSIDGPRWANEERRTLSGAETFERAMHGIELLREHNVAFSAIAVVAYDAIPRIVDKVDDYFGFFNSIGAREVGFNIEEQEGQHSVNAVDYDVVLNFWQALFDVWMSANGRPRVRDFSRVLTFARASLNGTYTEEAIDLMPTVTCSGDVVLLSPELAGHRDEHYGDFSVGNLFEKPLEDILKDGLRAPYVSEFLKGAHLCRRNCGYFDYCRAGQASNRYFEFGNFIQNVTQFCRDARMAPFDVVVGIRPPQTISSLTTAQRSSSG